MAFEPGVEGVVDLDELLRELTAAFANAAAGLDSVMASDAWAASPLVYRIPQAEITVRVGLSYSNRKLKGFFSKREASEKHDVLSTVRLSIVAVPRAESPPGEARRRRTS